MIQTRYISTQRYYKVSVFQPCLTGEADRNHKCPQDEYLMDSNISDDEAALGYISDEADPDP